MQSCQPSTQTSQNPWAEPGWILSIQPDKPTALLAHCCTSLVCRSQAISLKPGWKRGSYRFKNFPLGFISSVKRRSLPGLLGLPGNLLLHRWLGRMTAHCDTKCITQNMPNHSMLGGSLMFPKLHCLMSSLLNTALLWYCGDSLLTGINQKIKKGRSARTKSPPCQFVLDWISLQ